MIKIIIISLLAVYAAVGIYSYTDVNNGTVYTDVPNFTGSDEDYNQLVEQKIEEDEKEHEEWGKENYPDVDEDDD